MVANFIWNSMNHCLYVTSLNMLRSIIQTFHQQQLIVSTLNDYLDRQREVVLGPDLSDRRNVMQSY